MPSPLQSPRLPRGVPNIGTRRRSAELRFVAMDWAWMAAFAVIGAAVGVAAASQTRGADSAGLAAIWMPLASVGAYVSALVLKDRYAAVVAAALTSTSGTLAAASSLHPESGTAIVCAAAVWTLYEADWLLAASAVSAVGFLCRPEMLLLAVAVAGFGIAQRKPQAGPAVALLVVVLLTFLTLHVWSGKPLALPDDVASHGPYTVLWACGPAILWFLMAFLTDLSTPASRRKWLPLVSWLLLFVILGCSIDRWSSIEFFAPAFVAAYIACASGIARVLPALAGDMPSPVARYVVAASAVLLLICLRYPSDKHAAQELNGARAGTLASLRKVSASERDTNYFRGRRQEISALSANS